MDQVLVTDEKKSMFMPVKNGKIKLKTLQSHYTGAVGLTFIKNSHPCALDIDDQDNLEVAPGETEFNVVYNLASNNCIESNAKKRRQDHIMGLINGNKSDDFPILSSEKKFKPIKQETRTLICGWKHSSKLTEKPRLMPGASNVKIVLDLTKPYSFEEIKSLMVSQFQTQDNTSLFENSTIKLGSYDESILCQDSFTNLDGKACDFWGFSYKIKKGNHQLRLYLFTFKEASNSKFIDSHGKNKKLNTHDVDEVIKQMQQNYEEFQNKIVIEENENFCPNNAIKNFPQQDSAALKKQENNIEIWKKPARVNAFTNLMRCSSKIRVDSEDTASSSGSSRSSSLANFSSILRQTKKKKIEDKSIEVISSNNSKINNNLNKIITNGTLSSNNGMNLDQLEFSSIVVIKKENISKEINFNDCKQVLGSGSFGKVVKGVWRQSEVAIKIIKSIKTSPVNVYREIAVMEKLRHSSIINIMAIAQNDKYWFLIVEYFNGLNLCKILHENDSRKLYALDIDKRNNIGQQITSAVAFIHESGIFHKDLKPSNILVNRFGCIKICDFGLSRFVEMPLELETVAGCNIKGTYMFMSPEILDNNPGKGPADVWALSCILVELYNDRFVWNLDPLYKGSPVAEMKQIINQHVYPDLGKVPNELQCALLDCFVHNPLRRAEVTVLVKAYDKILKNSHLCDKI